MIVRDYNPENPSGVYPSQVTGTTYQALRRISPSAPVNLKTGRSDLRSLQLVVFGLGSDEDGI
jgi:hypothetical protein